jgi:hypothetical protein
MELPPPIPSAPRHSKAEARQQKCRADECVADACDQYIYCTFHLAEVRRTNNLQPAPSVVSPSGDPAGLVGPGPATRVDSVLAAFAASGVIAAAAGAVAGLIWGGIGGRIAMRVVFLTSDDRVRGVTSDDGFKVGTISSATMFLLILTTILGGLAGFAVGIIRMVTTGPTWAVAIGVSLAAAAYGGAGIVHTDGVDFRLLEPLWLTVGLFVLIPGLWGATVVVATERLLRFNIEGLPPRVLRRYWGASGWMLLVGITAMGIRGLLADIATLT